MKKRMIILITALIIVTLFCASGAVRAFGAGTVRYILHADKTEAKAGDTINYTVSLDRCEHIQSIQVNLEIPDGLIFLEGKEEKDIAQTLGAAMAGFSDITLTFVSFGAGDYSSDKETPLFSFSCQVADTAQKGESYSVGASFVEAADPDDVILDAVFVNDGTAVTVTGAGASSGAGAGFASLSGGSDSSSASSDSSGGEGAQDPQTQTKDGSPDSESSPASSSDGEGAVLTIGASSATAGEAGAGAGVPVWIFIVVVAAVIAAAVVTVLVIINKSKKKENDNGKEKL